MKRQTAGFAPHGSDAHPGKKLPMESDIKSNKVPPFVCGRG